MDDKRSEELGRKKDGQDVPSPEKKGILRNGWSRWGKWAAAAAGLLLAAGLVCAELVHIGTETKHTGLAQSANSWQKETGFFSGDVSLMAEEEMADSDSGSLSGSEGSSYTLAGSDRKLIRTITVTMETLDFDTFSTELSRQLRRRAAILRAAESAESPDSPRRVWCMEAIRSAFRRAHWRIFQRRWTVSGIFSAEMRKWRM